MLEVPNHKDQIAIFRERGGGEVGRWGTHRTPRPTRRSQCGGRVSRHKAPGVGD
ncbi:hypothetical protein [Fischerella muscicola]|uniref:hypothetical protein n=1 Tax=Fischerella muscicola TaxID=92938 RepID=UPI00138ABF3F|nr:hypothetical protein [Fischerella muscicola]